VSGSIYSWTGPNGFTSTSQNPTIAAATTAASGTYSVTQTVLGCTSPAGTTAATINPIPAAPVAGNNSAICAGQTLSLTSSVSGSIYNWTGPNGFTSTSQNPTIAAATTAASGTYSVTQTVLGCTSPAGTTAATINPIPAAPVAGNNSAICAGQTLSLTSSVSGSIYNWTGPNGFTSTSQNPTIAAATTAASGTYSVTQTVLGCTSPAGTTAATINPIPAAPVAGNNSAICAGQTLSLTSSVSGSIYSWTGPNGFTSTSQNPTIAGASTLATGDYSVTQTVLGCTSPAGTTAATINPIPAAPVAGNNSAICAGQTLSLTSSVSGSIYSWTGPNGFTSTSQNPTIAAATTAASGTYSVTQTVLGCTSPAGTTAATINPIPAAPVAGNNSAICAGQTLSLTSSVSGSIYSWTGPNGFTSSSQNPTIAGASILATGDYSVTQTVLGCTSVEGVTSVTVNPIPAAPTAANNSTICAGQTLSLTANPGGSIYNWSGPNSFTSTAQNPVIATTTTAEAGTYSVTQTVLGCESPAGTTTVVINPIPSAPILASNSAICAGQSLSLTATFTAGASYDWSGPNTYTANVQNPVISPASVSDSGTYTVFATIAGCAGPAATINVTINPIPAAPTASNNSGICAGQTLSLTANPGGAIYSWTGPNGFTSTSQNPVIPNASTLEAGTYSVTQTVLGCTSPEGLTSASVSPIPSAPVLSSNSAICAGQTLSLSSVFVSGAVYVWSGPNSFTSTVQNPVIIPATTSASGTYSAYIDVSGCTGPMSTVVVTVNPIPAAPTASNNSAICEGQTLNLTSNPAGSIYNWTGPNGFTSTSQNPSIAGTTTLATGDYSVTQTVAGCTSPEGITSVTVNPIPATPFGNSNSPVCGGQPLIFTLTAVPGIYSWIGPNSFTSTVQNPTISPAPFAATGNYSVTVTVLGCTSSVAIVSASVGTIPDAPGIGANAPVCAGSTLSLTASFTTGVAYSWTGPNSFTSTAQNPVITPASTLAAGVYTVNGSINGCNGPASTITVGIDVPAIVDAGIAKDTICATAGIIPVNGTVTGVGMGGNWTSLGTGTFNNPTSLSTVYNITNADTTAGIIQLVLTSTGGACPAVTDTITYVVLRSPYINVGADLNVCKNAYVALNATITGVTNTGTWTSTGTGSFAPNIGTLNGYYIPSSADTSSGQIKLTLETTNNKGCISRKDSLFVTFIQSPKADFSNTNACATQSLVFTDLSTPSPSIAGVTWDFGDGTGTSTNSNPTYTYAATNIYTVTHIVTLSNGCQDTIKKAVTVYNTPMADFTFTSVCVGNQSLFFDASNGAPDTLVAWNWNFGNGNSSILNNPTTLYTSTGTFPVTFTVTSSKGCSNYASNTVTVHPRPHADFAMSSTYVLAYDNVSFTDQSTPATLASWSWNFGNNTTSTLQNPNNTYTDKGIYPVMLAIKDNNGCADTTIKDIYVTLLPMVPSAFTPNNDGHNDTLFVKGGPFVKMSFRVYNSWGELLFTTDDQQKGWDGKYKGQQAPLGVYVWILDVDLYNGKSVRKTGDVTILK
jgi:gliding motility-associated-like protein